LPEGNPPAGFDGTVAYDPQTQQTLAFGTQLGSSLTSVWSFQAGAWTNITNGTGNLTHQGMAELSVSTAYDAADGYLLLFGEGYPYNPETWAYRSGTWTLLTPSVEPSGTIVAGLAYDVATASVILVTSGIVDHNTTMITWSFHADNWTQVPTVTPLPLLWRASMAYDNSSSDQELVLFAWDPSGERFGNETWVYRGGDWHDVTATSGNSPPPSEVTMTYDSAENAVLLVSSGSVPYQMQDRTWEFADGQWSYVSTPGVAPFMGQGQQNLVFDAHDGYAVFVGAFGSLYTGKETNETWKFDRTSLGPAPLAFLNVTPQNSSVGTPIRITAQATGGYGAIGVSLDVDALGCYLAERSLGSWSCNTTSGGRGGVLLEVRDQAGRTAYALVGFNVSSPASSSADWTWYAALGGVGIAVVLAGILVVRYRRKKAPGAPGPEGGPPRHGVP